ncbi:MAG: NAD(+)/NADH kinase, partial [Proteobacteria bacterium]|nr:NAD(+)/NADH kinase [Pseudomonadota bacterium]
SDDVAAVVAGPNGVIEGVQSGSIVIDMSTISPKTSVALAEQLKPNGVQLLDAPVTGGVAGAQAGTLSILVGGEDSAFERALPLLEKMGANVTHVGPSGAGHTTKLANQILAAGCMSGISEALVFAKKAGLDLDTWFKAVENGAGASWHLSNMAPKIIDGDFSAGYMVKHHQKDLRLIQETAGENAVSVPMTALVSQLYRSIQASWQNVTLKDATRPLAELEAELVDEVLAGNYQEDQRLYLEVALSSGAKEQTLNALNDVVIQRSETGRMVDIETTVDGQYVNTHTGDGLIIATATGSTAYALSCGGPIIQPSLDALLLVPVCPHTLSDRPIVIPANSAISLRLARSPRGNVPIFCDGHLLGNMGENQTLSIRASKHRLTLIHPADYDYYRMLRSKLRWGDSSRSNREPTT